MKALFKVLLGIFAVIGVLFSVLLIVFFFPTNNDDSENLNCNEKVIIDTTSVPIKNGMEDYDKFRHLFFTNYSFQKSRTRFPMRGIPGSMWSMENWTPCNWTTLTPYYMDTITYSFRKPKYYKENPYERQEEIYIKSDTIKIGNVTKLTFKLEKTKWFLTERI